MNLKMGDDVNLRYGALATGHSLKQLPVGNLPLKKKAIIIWTLYTRYHLADFFGSCKWSRWVACCL